MDLQLDKLDIAYNQLSGRVPNSFRFNKECTIELTTNRFQGPLPLWSSNITMLYLGDNQFSGPIPPNIGEVMPLLSDLDVADNSLSGSIPLSIGNLTGLMTLVISNNELSGQIPYFRENKQSMYIVDMSNNSLSGTIPTTKSYLSFLQFLVLSSNKLSCEIPSSLKNYTNMFSLDLGDNIFIGKLPAWIGESQTPSSIGNFEWIETLDISMNQISGPIPLSMTCLTFMNHLNLSYNNLSGKIPTTNQFLTLDDPSIYQGNAGLYGRPLSTECPDNGQRKPGGDEEDRDGDGGGKLEKLGFIISIVIFCGVLGSLWDFDHQEVLEDCIFSLC
ncbi:hypothetical protein FEM48_Zijuj09G0217800 [Ziziphus jujuba var. spinosa]|uniref:Uncharacterized protein n=1 Tax=Ziziphus jujuba var. spinosa TaxID=714518 RepID=A0A978UVH8_ZIZJJ|nr:hypothetical protein FEM48_Zijuj09G0217800 [Ziziphus jujuba var. spinosa]